MNDILRRIAMPNLAALENAMPVAPLKIIATDSCMDFAKKVNDYLVEFRANTNCDLKNDPAFQEYAEDRISDLIRDKKGITSTWIGNKAERLRNIKATMIDLKFVNNDFYVVTFLSQNNNIFKWLTRSNVNEEYLSSSSLLITGTVKDHIIDKYENNAKVTLLSRVVIKET